MKYPVTRERSRQGWFKDREAYYRGRAELSEGASPNICQVMNKAFRETYPQPLYRAGTPEGASWNGLPWLTIVLGSGAVATADEPDLNAANIAEQVATIVAGFDMVGSGYGHFIEQARTFTEALVHDRMLDVQGGRGGVPDESIRDGSSRAIEPERESSGGSERRTWSVESVAAKLTLSTALLTEWFNEVRSSTYAPLSRWDDDEAVYYSPGARNRPVTAKMPPNIIPEVLDPALGLLHEVTISLEAGNTRARREIADAVKRLLEVITDALESTRSNQYVRRLHIEHLRLLTEVCWHFLMLDTSVYPGWTELLLGLLLQETETDDPGHVFRHARPRFEDLRQLPQAVRDLLEPATEHSWRLSDPELARTGVQRPRDALYLSVADVLWAQADAPSMDMPLPVTFVTSFDLEAEMGLWVRGLERLGVGRAATFNVALPVHVLDDHGDEPEAEPCWLVARIDPDPSVPWMEQLDRRLKRPTRWDVVRPDRAGTFSNTPTVVHLGGCPLFELPRLSEHPHLVLKLAELQIETSPSSRLVHAVTVDEYVALRQSEAEVFWSAPLARERDDRMSRGLPPAMMSDGRQNPRFWIALGVPIGDPAVRHRLVSQMTVRRIQQLRAPGAASRATDPAVQALRQSHSRPGAPQTQTSSPADDNYGLGRRRPPRSTGVEPDGAPEGDEPTDRLRSPAADEGNDGSDLTSSPRFDMNGVVVNRRINDDEATLLYWLGLDVVYADCQAFLPDLQHYTLHLRAPDGQKRMPLRAPCPLPATYERSS